jgi:hypothetical protein
VKTLNLKEKSVLVFDYGLFICVAKRLAEDFGKVYYYVPWKCDFPTSDRDWVGRGIDGVEKIREFHKYKDKVDMIVFTTIYDGDLQQHLRRRGYKVFGAGDAEKYERNRWLFKKALVDLKLPVPKTARVIGIEDLRKYLPTVEGVKWIKTSEYRGDFETYKHENLESTNLWLDDLVSKMLPPRQKTIEFLVEDEVEGVETGGDWFVSDGVYSNYGTVGYEVKSEGYICKVFKESELPEPIALVNRKTTPLLKGYYGAYSTEVRIGRDRKPYYVDATMRFGSPPAEIQCELYENFSEVIWDVANGLIPHPRPIARYGALLRLTSEWAAERPCYVEYPKEIDRWIKLRNYCVDTDTGKSYIVPSSAELISIGSVVAISDSVDSAMQLCKDRAKKVGGSEIDWGERVFDEGMASVKEGLKYGINLL